MHNGYDDNAIFADGRVIWIQATAVLQFVVEGFSIDWSVYVQSEEIALYQVSENGKTLHTAICL